MNRQKFLKISGMGGLAVLLQPSLVIDAFAQQKKEKGDETFDAYADISQYVSKLKQLSDVDKKEIEERLQEVTDRTGIGRNMNILLRDANVDVEQVSYKGESTILFYYDSIKDKVYETQMSLNERVGHYLLGQPTKIFRAHEIIHAVQSRNSVMDQFYRMLSKYSTVGPNGTKVLPSNKKLIEEFTEKFPKYANHEGKDKLENLLSVFKFYNATYLQRRLIHEVQAHTAFDGYTNADVLYNYMKGSKDYTEWLSSIPKNMFDDTFRASLIINGITSAKNAARTAGENDYSIEKYVEKAAEIEGDINNNDAVFQQALNQQKVYLKDRGRIAIEARKLIDAYYLKGNNTILRKK